MEGWERFVRRLIDAESMQIYITGSSAKLLSTEIATSLRGRTITREIFPYSFREFLRHRQQEIPIKVTSKDKMRLSAAVLDFLRWGGFPETVGAESALHRELLQGYLDVVILRDIVDRYRVSNTIALRKLLTHCLHNAASILSVNKFYHTLQSQGIAVSKDSLYTLMHYLEDAYSIFSISSHELSAKKSAQRPNKVYPVDQGLVTAQRWSDTFLRGARLETAIFSHLRRSTTDLSYYTTEEGWEIDFLVGNSDNLSLIQVSLSLQDPVEREIRALRSAMRELQLQQGVLVHLEEEEEIAVPEGCIICLPAWKFLLTW